MFEYIKRGIGYGIGFYLGGGIILTIAEAMVKAPTEKEDEKTEAEEK